MDRWLGQRDPLSSFLYLMVVEGFNLLMKKVVESIKFMGYRFEVGDVAFHISNIQTTP